MMIHTGFCSTTCTTTPRHTRSSCLPVITPGACAAMTAWGIPICWPRSWGAANAPKTDAPATASLREGGPKTLSKGKHTEHSTRQHSQRSHSITQNALNLASWWESTSSTNSLNRSYWTGLFSADQHVKKKTLLRQRTHEQTRLHVRGMWRCGHCLIKLT